MVCLPRVKCVINASLAVMLMLCGGFSDSQNAWAWGKAKHAASQSSGQLGILSVGFSQDGASLVLNTSRFFTDRETQDFSILRLPSPYRLLLDVPNAVLTGNKTVFPMNRNGIDRVELSQNNSPFYSSVRATVYVNDGQTLARLHPVFEGASLKLEGFPAIAMTAPSANAVQKSGNSPVMIESNKTSTRRSSGRHSSAQATSGAQPLPPVAKPMASISMMKVPPVPGVENTDVGRQNSDSSVGKQTVLGNAATQGTNIVEDIYFRDNRLFIKGNTSAELHVKNRFVLTEPNRVVLDLDNAVLANRGLLNSISGNSDAMRQIRVGQFDEKTVRFVIEGSDPQQIEAVYPANGRNLLAISSDAGTSINKLSSNTRLGEIQTIDLKRQSDSTILRLTASAPIVHRFVKRDNKVTLELLNEASHPSPIDFDQKQYPEISKMRLEPLTDGQPNSKLMIQLADANVRVVPTMSDDGQVMELLIANDGSNAGATSVLSNLAGLGTAGKAPFPARIVVDAGHGGKDIGANRNGVNEKDLNLSLALMVRDALAAKGFKVYMTRSSDVFLPLPEITAITNRIHPDLFISIHHNASVNPALKGLETYYFTPQSVALARRVHAREINAVGVRDGGVKQARFYVIHHTPVPAILCEVGYVSNPSELDELQTMERKLKTSHSIADGVVDYLRTRISAKAR